MDEQFGEVISSYSRARAIADGVLVDVSTVGQEAGIVYPVALTTAVQGVLESIPNRLRGIADYNGRLWDLLWMARCAMRKAVPGVNQVVYEVIMPTRAQWRNGHRERYVIHVGPGDTIAPVITIMQEGED